jgi:hypothetical protein
LGDLLRKCGIATQLSSRNVRQLMVCEYYDNGRAVNDLAMPRTPIAHAIEDFFAWYSPHPDNIFDGGQFLATSAVTMINKSHKAP